MGYTTREGKMSAGDLAADLTRDCGGDLEAAADRAEVMLRQAGSAATSITALLPEAALILRRRADTMGRVSLASSHQAASDLPPAEACSLCGGNGRLGSDIPCPAECHAAEPALASRSHH
jgi:hypothetical protein